MEAVKFNDNQKKNSESGARSSGTSLLVRGERRAEGQARSDCPEGRTLSQLHRAQGGREISRDQSRGRRLMDLAPKLLYTRPEAAGMLSISVSSLDVLIGRGMLRAVRKGRRVLVHKTELERIARQNIPTIWPAKEHGKTVNRPEAHS